MQPAAYDAHKWSMRSVPASAKWREEHLPSRITWVVGPAACQVLGRVRAQEMLGALPSSLTSLPRLHLAELSCGSGQTVHTACECPGAFQQQEWGRVRVGPLQPPAPQAAIPLLAPQLLPPASRRPTPGLLGLPVSSHPFKLYIEMVGV